MISEQTHSADEGHEIQLKAPGDVTFFLFKLLSLLHLRNKALL